MTDPLTGLANFYLEREAAKAKEIADWEAQHAKVWQNPDQTVDHLVLRMIKVIPESFTYDTVSIRLPSYPLSPSLHQAVGAACDRWKCQCPMIESVYVFRGSELRIRIARVVRTCAEGVHVRYHRLNEHLIKIRNHIFATQVMPCLEELEQVLAAHADTIRNNTPKSATWPSPLELRPEVWHAQFCLAERNQKPYIDVCHKCEWLEAEVLDRFPYLNAIKFEIRRPWSHRFKPVMYFTFKFNFE